MLIHDAIFTWEGWGGKLQLASGKCRLRIYDRSKSGGRDIAFLKPYVVIVSDVPGSKMSVRSCAGHIATMVSQDFHIDPHRTFWVEYYPKIIYGAGADKIIPEHYVAVDFEWYKGKAISPKWRQLGPPLLDIVQDLVNTSSQPPK